MRKRGLVSVRLSFDIFIENNFDILFHYFVEEFSVTNQLLRQNWESPLV